MPNKANVIIPAAGLGTRMRPLSNGLSKTLIPLNGKPILAWIIESLEKLHLDIQEIMVVTNDSGDVQRFLDNTYRGTPIHSKLKTVVQKYKYGGPGGAILYGIDALHDKENGILVWLGDTVCTYPGFRFHESFVATSPVPSETSARWCLPEIQENGQLTFVNKPAHYGVPGDTIDALIGVYWLKNYNPCLDLDNWESEEDATTMYEISDILDVYQDATDEPIGIKSVGSDWYDCGELESYYASKARLLSKECREQSGLYVNPELGTVTKYANNETNKAKLAKEAGWYSRLSGSQLMFAPKLINVQDDSYTMELAPGTTLADMLVYENIPASVWNTILCRIVDVFHKYFVIEPLPKEALNDVQRQFDRFLDKFYLERTITRLDTHRRFYQELDRSFRGEYFVKFIESFVEASKQEFAKEYYLGQMPGYITSHEYGTTIHGDFHLGNILFDSMLGRYTFLDPRGDMGLGDARYDMAKLYHDLYCGYFLIVRGLYSIVDNQVVFSRYYENYMKKLEQALDRHLAGYGYDVKLLKQLAIIQMLTCIPFHQDNRERCRAFLLRSKNLITSDFASDFVDMPGKPDRHDPHRDPHHSRDHNRDHRHDHDSLRKLPGQIRPPRDRKLHP